MNNIHALLASIFRAALSGFFFACLVIGVTQAQSIVSTTSFNPPGVTNNVGFNGEVAIVNETNFAYIGGQPVYGDEVAAVNLANNSTSPIPLPTTGIINSTRVNQMTKLVYFRQGASNIVVIDGRPTSATFNTALPSIVFTAQNTRGIDIDESRGLLYVTHNNATGTVQSRVTIIDVNPANATFHQTLAEVPLPATGTAFVGVTVNSLTNKIYLAAFGGTIANAGVYVLNGGTRELQRIANTQPSDGVIVNESSNLVYAGTSNRLNAIDGATDALLGVINLSSGFFGSESMALNSATNRLYLASNTTNGVSNTGRIIVIDTARASGTFNIVLANIVVDDVGSSGIVVDETSNRVFAPSFNEYTTHIIDGATNNVVARIPITGSPRDIAINSLMNRAVIVGDLHVVQVINTADSTLEASFGTAAAAGAGVFNAGTSRYFVQRTADFTEIKFFNTDDTIGFVSRLSDHNGRLVFMAQNPNTNRIYSINSAANFTGQRRNPGYVSVIDADSAAVIANVETGGQPFGVAVNSVTNKIYVANTGFGPAFPSSVSVIDGATNTVTTATNFSGISNPLFQSPIINEATNKVYFRPTLLVLDGANNGIFRQPDSFGNGNVIGFNADGTRIYVNSSTGLRVINSADDSLITTLPITANELAADASRGRTYITDSTAHALHVINATSNEIIARVPVGSFPTRVSVNPVNGRIYVGDFTEQNIRFIDPVSLRVRATINLPFDPGTISIDSTNSRLYVPSVRALVQSGVAVISDLLTINGLAFENGVPLAGVTITLKRGNAVLATTQTNPDGTFAFRNLAAGVNYFVQATKPGITFPLRPRSLPNLSGNETVVFKGQSSATTNPLRRRQR